MNLHQLLGEANIPHEPTLPDLPIEGVTCHTRRVRKNSLYVCIRGLHQNGADLAADAASRGAVALICHRDDLSRMPQGIPALSVSNPRQALASLCSARCGHPGRELKLIGITGTNGKTSTGEMLFHIFNQTGHPAGVIGTLGCRLPHGELDIHPVDPNANMTTPDPEELYPALRSMADGGMEYAVMEVTSHALALSKVTPLCFSAGVFTNLTPDHLDLHGTMEAYAAAKASLFASCEISILWGADPCAPQMAANAGGKVIYLPGIHPVYGTACAAPGDFTPINASLAGVTAQAMGLAEDEIKTALSAFPGVPGRMEQVAPDADLTLYLDYAHTPDALEKALDTAKKLTKGRVILLFGCGGERDKGKRPLMGRVAARGADLVYLTSDNPRSEDPMEIIKDIERGIPAGTSYRVIPDRESAIRQAVGEARAQDLLLFTGKGHEHYIIDREGKHPFFEKEIALDAWKKKRRQR